MRQTANIDSRFYFMHVCQLSQSMTASEGLKAQKEDNYIYWNFSKNFIGADAEL